MFLLLRILLYLFLVWGTVCGLVVVFIKKKFWWRRLIIFIVLLLLAFYFVFGCTSPMRPKVNVNSIEEGVPKLFEYAIKNHCENIEDCDSCEFNMFIYDNDVTYIVGISPCDSPSMAQKEFVVSANGRYEIKKSGDIQYYVTKFFRGRDWDRYMGASSGCYGCIEVLYDSYLIEIIYEYADNSFEELISVICPPETFYREEIDLGSIDLEKASIEFG